VFVRIHALIVYRSCRKLNPAPGNEPKT